VIKKPLITGSALEVFFRLVINKLYVARIFIAMIDRIKNLITNYRGTKTFEWKTEASIFQFIVSNLNAEGKLKGSANDLPDEKPQDENGLRYAPGAFDSLFGAEDSDKSKSEVDELVKLIKKISENADKESEAKFYELITSTEHVIGVIDAFLDRAVNLRLSIDPYLVNFSKDLAFKTGHRNSVKFGIAMIGICQEKSVIDDIKLIGLHDEFTLFSVVSILNLSDDKVNDLWELAKKVDGWGKIHIVERLAKMELTNDIKDWLIIDGYKNSIMYEYLTYTCAVNGELHSHLGKAVISKKLFKASADIIEALIAGGPAEDISIYSYASITIENFVRHSKKHADEISAFIVLNHIKDFLIELQTDISLHKENGWTEDIISNCLIDIVEIINSKDWSVLALIALKSSDNVDYWNGKQAAKMLNIDIWDVLWQRLQNNPSESSMWYDVVNGAKPSQADQVIEFALAAIPLKELASGPRDSSGLGPQFLRYWSLDYMTTFLENYPKKGEAIILAALDSPVTRNRNMAFKVLHKWGNDNWSNEIHSKLLNLKSNEPNKKSKENVNRLLEGRDLI